MCDEEKGGGEEDWRAASRRRRVGEQSQEDQQVADIGFHLKVIEPFSISLHSLGLLRSHRLELVLCSALGGKKAGEGRCSRPRTWIAEAAHPPAASAQRNDEPAAH